MTERMTIGELIDALRQVKADSRVQFDFANCVPGQIASWRGIYSEPALGWKATGYSRAGGGSQDAAPTVGLLVAELLNATDGREYEGWKGGDFTYRLSSPLHVDNPGDYSKTAIVGVDDRDYYVVLQTADLDD